MSIKLIIPGFHADVLGPLLLILGILMTDATRWVARELELVLTAPLVHLAFDFNTNAIVVLDHKIPASFVILNAFAFRLVSAISCESAKGER